MGVTTGNRSDALEARLARIDWTQVEASLRERPYARTAAVLSARECAGLIASYADDRLFRSRVDMERHRFGVGDYKYFTRPLPPLVQLLRDRLYAPLAAIANRWMEALGEAERYPPRLPAFLRRCAAAGQAQPTPLLLHYETGGYNCLHQDLYGVVAFPLQAAVLLSRRNLDYAGGAFLLVEQRPRAQSIAEAVSLEQGELLIFANRVRPVPGVSGYYRANVQHGVSVVRSGRRYTLGVIFHDAA